MAQVDAICCRYGMRPSEFLDRPLGDLMVDFAIYTAGIQADAVAAQQAGKGAFPVLIVNRRGL